MNFEAVICNFIKPEQKKENDPKKKQKYSEYYILNFIKNKISRDLMIKDSKVFSEICLYLRFKCILTTFHEEFSVIKGIGRGSFAKVLLNL